MPLLNDSYRCALPFRSAHLSTIFPTLFRRVAGVSYRRRRLDTPDGDFVDVDISSTGASRAVVVVHGLEGDSSRAYMRGMIRAVNQRGWDGVAYNLRGCSGSPNRLPRFYHSGDTDDLQTVLDALGQPGGYDALALVGFSLGGNIVARYLGERGHRFDSRISWAACVSTPCDLAGAAAAVDGLWQNRIYLKRFLWYLKGKVRQKAEATGHDVGVDRLAQVHSFRDFDEFFTAPLHGFSGAEEYWRECSAGPVLPQVTVPLLMLTARDDPLLSDSCYPMEAARHSDCVHLELPAHGGHVGFVIPGAAEYWHEQRIMDFAVRTGRWN